MTEVSPNFTIPPPPPVSEVDKLRFRLDQLVAQVGDAYPNEMLARALMAKAADMLLANKGMISAIWATQRLEDLLAGHWSPESIKLFIEIPNR